MLREVRGRLQGASCEAVQELEYTIASLQQIKNGLEETEEYRTALAEKELISKCDRVLQLKKCVQESKVAAEKLLGYPLKPEHFINGSGYKLMPMGYVAKATFDTDVQQFQKQIAIAEEALDRFKGEIGVKKARSSFGGLDQKSQLAQLEDSLRHQRSRLLGYMMSCEPMLDATFSETLAVHLDAMLDAYLELRAA